MADKLTTDDWVSISDFMGEYCWRVDEGDGDGWAALFTPDGVFSGAFPEPLVGPAQLRMVPINAYKDGNQGMMRHLVANLTCRYGETRDVVHAKLYNYVSMWGGVPGAGNLVMALCRVTFVRSGDSWLIKENAAKILTP
jgi:SnoaL-like domain